ncbi:MAG: hypothetical protein GY941_07865 [Planctomycetes bacterium]|nr:hypothetical protein [Planctomycetota bacterium]
MAFLLVFLLLIGTGCQKPGPYLVRQTPSETPFQHSERLIALDKSAAAALYFVNHQQSRSEAGQVYIQINLQNVSAAQDIWMDWKVVFYDKQNFQIEETEWNQTFFPAKEVKTLKVNSLRRDVEKFTVMVRSPSTTDGNPYEVKRNQVR